MALRAASNEAFRAKVRARHKSVHRSTARCGNECQANSIPCRLCTVRISVFRQFRPCSCDWSASPVRPSAAFRRRSIRPYKITSTWTDGRTTTEFTEIQPNANLPATRFAKPAPARPIWSSTRQPRFLCRRNETSRISATISRIRPKHNPLKNREKVTRLVSSS